MKPPIINIDALEFKRHAHGDSFEAETAAAGRAIGARKLGYRVVVVPPGKRAWPYHTHLVNEEMFFVLEGKGTLRYAGEEHPIRAGDFVASPADTDSPHQIINTSDKDIKYIAVSTMEAPDVFLYPDSDKFGVFAGSAPGTDAGRVFSIFSRKEYEVDYWDGES